MEPNIETGLNLQVIRDQLNFSDWEEDPMNPGTETRQVFLGSVFGLTPSGKYYLPFACSNVEECPQCHGKGSLRGHRRQRIIKKAIKRLESLRQAADKRGQGYRDKLVKRHAFLRQSRVAYGYSCEFCGGLGSREAYLDQIWNEKAEAELESIGASLASGEGDPCDLFAAEYRDAEEEENVNEE
jgi:hypothetical protein